MEVSRRRGRRRKKLLDDLKERRGYCHLKEAALDRIMWRNRFGGAIGPVVRQNTEGMNDCKTERIFFVGLLNYLWRRVNMHARSRILLYKSEQSNGPNILNLKNKKMILLLKSHVNNIFFQLVGMIRKLLTNSL